MVSTSKTRLGKRKLEIKEVRKENQVIASKKHDKQCFAEVDTKKATSAIRKPQIKSEMDLTKELNYALLEEVHNNEEAMRFWRVKRRSI